MGATISGMSNLFEELRADLTAESDALGDLLERLDEPGWNTPTLCLPWTVKDQVSHLAHNDDATVFALTNPEVFRQTRPTTLPDIQRMVDQVIVDHHDDSGESLLRWFRLARRGLLDAFEGHDPRERIPWYGPDMSVMSKLTARFMETWAHGYDVVEALGLDYRPTDRARHVVFLGLQATPNTFTTHGRPVPQEPIRIEANAPSGATMHFGKPDASNVVRGDLFDLALIVTQRRHVDDTGVHAEGAVAAEWLSIAQAFAGPPGSGRAATIVRAKGDEQVNR